MIAARSNWNGDQAHRMIVAGGWDAIRRVTVYFWNACQTTLNVSNPRPYTTPSQPGQPPRKRTGYLAANVVYEFDEASQTSRVGVLSNARYGLFLEIGTRFMAARPWLAATLRKVMPQLQAIAGTITGTGTGGKP